MVVEQVQTKTQVTAPVTSEFSIYWKVDFSGDFYRFQLGSVSIINRSDFSPWN